MAFHLIVSATIPLFLLLTTKTHSQFINEIHYDNEGLDVNEAVEIAAPAGTDLSGWSLQFYNGNGGSLYQKVSLFGVTPSQINGWGFRTFAISSIQNGPDAIALVNDAGSLVEFLSYEGVVTGVAGVADGVRSTDISVAESSSTSTNSSLQRVGTGNSAPDFSWTGPIQSSFGDVNDGQTFTALPPCPTTFVNEMRLEGIDAKLNETVEIAALAATDLSGWQLALYHGRDGKRYKTVSLFGVVSDESHGWGTLEFDVSPVLTGELIGVALVDDAGGVLQFLSAGGTLTAVDGPAQGKRSVDVGVEESGSPPSTHSLQLVGDGNNACDYRWTGPAPSSFGSVNIGQRFTTTASSGDSSGEGGGGRGVVEGNAEQVQKVSIGAIQGESHISPLDGERVNVQGIVTAVGSRGFYIQDGIGDGNDATSDAIWVFSRSRAAVNVGDEVSVIGMVTEFFQGGQGTNRLSLTELSEPSFEVLSSNNELPAVVVLGVDGRQPPSESIDAKPTEFDVVNDGLDFYESLEGMRVRVKNAVVISPKSRFGAIWVVGDGGVGATGLNERGALTIAQNDFNPERIQIDDDNGILGGFVTPNVSVGDSLGDVTGVLTYDFGNYKVIATLPYTSRAGGLQKQRGSLKKRREGLLIGSMNALNLDPCDGMKKFDALAEVVVKRLNQPDIVALQEIQDNDGSEQSGITSANKTLQMLSEAIVRTGGERYAVLDNPFIGDDTNGGQPGGNIRCAFLYAADRVKLVDVDTVVNSTEQRRNRQNAFYNSRLPLVGRFASVANGEVLTVINVHFSSKGGSAPIFGRVQPVEELQDNNVVNKGTDERVRQAQAVMRFVSEQRDEKVMVVGDFNEFEFNAALGVFKLGGMRVLTEDKVDRKDRYSFVFEGQGQTLDHVVVSSGLAERSLLQIVHCNAEFDERNRASDHEPLLASISLC